jgi:hypothetical protein
MSIRDKQTMYKMLAAGDFGNTIPQYFSLDEWATASPTIEQWGVRTLSPGGPCKLFCHRDDVPATVGEFEQAGHRVNISCMIDAVLTVTAWLEVYESPTGLVVYGIEYPKKGTSWRKEMPYRGQHWQGSAACAILRKHMNANSLDDLRVLLDSFTGHVVEFSACEQCFGTVPHRNCVTWEVRNY